jgi:GWxTD domain-containing protein
MPALLAVAFLVLASTPRIDGPASAIAAGRTQIEAGNCSAAIETLQRALPDAANILIQRDRNDALAALHFYTALAFSNCEMPDKCREQLREFFRFRPGQSSVDATKFPTEFVAAFGEMQHSRPTSDSFDGFYPGFNEYGDFADERMPLMLWGTSPAFQILADDSERSGWGVTRSEESQSAFIQNFWSRRDSDPDTQRNEFKEKMQRRVFFADRAFASPEDERGSMSDRGRVFVLLGPPARVRRQGLQRYETTIVGRRTRTPLTGSLEYWVYFPPQLPIAVPAQQLEFRFITQPGYGDGIMQKDFLALKALAEARKAYAARTAKAE